MESRLKTYLRVCGLSVVLLVVLYLLISSFFLLPTFFLLLLSPPLPLLFLSVVHNRRKDYDYFVHLLSFLHKRKRKL